MEVPQDRSIESAPQQHIPSLTQIDKKANTLGKNSQQTSSKDCACDNFVRRRRCRVQQRDGTK